MASIKQREIQLAGKPQLYQLRRSRRAKHLLLHVDTLGQVELVVPWRASFKEAERFIAERHDWLARRVAQAQQRVAGLPRYRFVSGERLPFLGEQLELVIRRSASRQRARVTRDGKRLVVEAPTDTHEPLPAIERWYKKQARQFVAQSAPPLAQQIGVTITRLAIGSYRSQWGSATKAGRLALNWRLMLAPAAVMRYVIAHEVAHLRHPNHSPQFWELVEQLQPGYRHQRRWLRQHEHELVLRPEIS